MRTREEIIESLLDPGLIAVIRTGRAEQVAPVCAALVAGGVRALEVTLTVPRALEMVRETSRMHGSAATVGAGSVLDVAQAEAAMEAGAEFLVSPICRPELVGPAHARGRVMVLGAYTPTEAEEAHRSGADFVKLFPAETLGPGYIKSVRAPLPHLRIIPTGGVDLKTAPEFLAAGCVALGVGSSLLRKDLLQTEDWPALRRLAEEYVRVVREWRKGLREGS